MQPGQEGGWALCIQSLFPLICNVGTGLHRLRFTDGGYKGRILLCKKKQAFWSSPQGGGGKVKKKKKYRLILQYFAGVNILSWSRIRSRVASFRKNGI